MDLDLLLSGIKSITGFEEDFLMFGYKMPSFIKQISVKKLSIFLVVLYAAGIVPMLVIGMYNWPSADDFSMALEPHQAFSATGSFFVTIGSAFVKTIDIYNNWVGYFFSSFMTCISPSIFAERLSALNPVIVLGMLTLGVIYLFDSLLCKVWKMDKHLVMCVSMLTLIMIVQCMETGSTRAEAFYWWSGAINYTFMFGLSLVWIGMLFRFIYEKNGKSRIWRLVGLCVWGFLLGGSNYMTALVMAVFSGLTLFVTLMIKLKKFWLEVDGNIKGVWIALICPLLGLAVSAAAPGNRIRGTEMGSTSPIRVILRSYYSVFDICVNDMLRWEVVFLLVVGAILAWKMAAGMMFKLQHPVMFSLFSISMMACCVAPPLYAVGGLDAVRIRSTMWMQFLVMLVLTVVYIACWVRQNLFASGSSTGESLSLISSTLIAAVSVILLFGSLLCVYVTPNYYSATSAVYDLVSGNAKIYLEENYERLEILQNDDIKDALLKSHSAKPELLYQGDVYEDSGLWENGVVAKYYGKDTVALDE